MCIRDRVCMVRTVPFFMKASLIMLAPLCIVFGVLAPELIGTLIGPADVIVLNSGVHLFLPDETLLMWVKDVSALLLGIPVAYLAVKKARVLERIHDSIHIDLNRATAAAVLTLTCVLLFMRW